jgi:hypothetical protein
MNYKRVITGTANSGVKMLTDGRNLYRRGRKVPFAVKACVATIDKDQEIGNEIWSLANYSNKFYDIHDPVLKDYGIENVVCRINYVPDLGDNGRTYEVNFELSCQYDLALSDPTDCCDHHSFLSNSQSFKDEWSDWIVSFELVLIKDGGFDQFGDFNWMMIESVPSLCSGTTLVVE